MAFWKRASERQRAGRDIGDPAHATAWRRKARPQNVALLDFYGRFLVGQWAGMTNALSVEAAETAFQWAGMPLERRAEMFERLRLIHGLYVEATEEK